MDNKISLSEFNLIDIFGYLVPGSLLLAGAFIPINITFEFLDLPLIAGLTLIGLFAFVVGMAVSRIEGLPWFLGMYDQRYQPQHVFSEDLFQAQERYPRDPGEDSEYISSEYFDYEVWLLCQDKFSLPENLSQSGYHLLWLGVLSYLETTSYTRAFRMQALYTFSSNMLIVSELLSFYYLLLIAFKGLGKIHGLIFNVSTFLILFRGMPILIGLLIVAVVFMRIFIQSSTFFLSQWHLYSKIEFYMDQKMNS